MARDDSANTGFAKRLELLLLEAVLLWDVLDNGNAARIRSDDDVVCAVSAVALPVRIEERPHSCIVPIRRMKGDFGGHAVRFRLHQGGWANAALEINH